MRRFILLVFVSLMIIPISAQDGLVEARYRLKVPSAEEFLLGVSEIPIGCNWDYPSRSQFGNPWDLCTYLIPYIEDEFGDELNNLPYDLLSKIVEQLSPGQGMYSYGHAELWNEALILSWLRDKNVDLDSESEISFGDIDIQVDIRDFNADGIHEYVLKIENSYHFAAYFVVSRQSDGSYTRIPDPFPVHLEGMYWDYSSGYLKELGFDDYNGDGIPEWFLVFDGASYRGTYSGEIFLVGWREGEIRPLDNYAINYFPFFDTNASDLNREELLNGYLFKNIDDDPALELQSVNVTRDNWRCPKTVSNIFDWDVAADTYVNIRDNIHYSETVNCVMNDAEYALYEQNYTSASHLYKYAMTLPSEDNDAENSEQFENEMRQYIQLRLAQAYLLNREYDEASIILDNLSKQRMVSDMAQQMFDLLLRYRYALPIKTCVAMFNLFQNVVNDSPNYDTFRDQIGTSLTVGVKQKFAGDFLGAGNPADAAFAGCNIPAQIDGILEHDINILSTRSPILQLEELGFLIHDYIVQDFDGDGDEDWLIWHEAYVPAVFLLNEGEGKTFAKSRKYFPRPDDYVSWEVVTLPDHSGIGVLQFNAKEGMPSGGAGYTCGDSASVLGDFLLWQYLEDELKTTILSTWCDDRPTGRDLFQNQDGQSIFYVRNLREGTQEELPFVWDTDVGRYVTPIHVPVLQADSINQSPSDPVVQLTPTNKDLYILIGDGVKDYYIRLDEQVKNATSIDAKIAILNHEINSSYVDFPYPLQYWKATILDKASRDDEALSEYLTIYESAPESAWVILAGLHIEPIANN